MRNLINFIIGIVGLTVLHGCGNSSSTESATTPSGTRVPLTQVRLGYFANITHAQALVGVARGDFQKALGSVPLKTSVFNAGPAAMEALFAGELDLVYVGPGPAVNAYFKSAGKLRVVAGAAANGVVIVARKDSGVAKLEDLKGKRIATPQYGNTQDIAARAFVKNRLQDKEKKDGGTTTIETVTNAEQFGLFKQGQLDAAWAPEPWATRLIHEAGGVAIEEEKNLWDEKKFSITLIVASKEFLDKHPDVVEALLNAHTELTEFVRSSPELAAPIMNEELKKLQGKALAPEILKEALTRVDFGTDPLPATVDKMAQWYFELGFTKAKPDLKNLFDLTILNKLKAAKK